MSNGYIAKKNLKIDFHVFKLCIYKTKKKKKHCKIKENICSKMTSLKAKSTNDFFLVMKNFHSLENIFKKNILLKIPYFGGGGGGGETQNYKKKK